MCKWLWGHRVVPSPGTLMQHKAGENKATYSCILSPECPWLAWHARACVTWGWWTEQSACCSCRRGRHMACLPCGCECGYADWSPGKNACHTPQMCTEDRGDDCDESRDFPTCTSFYILTVLIREHTNPYYCSTSVSTVEFMIIIWTLGIIHLCQYSCMMHVCEVVGIPFKEGSEHRWSQASKIEDHLHLQCTKVSAYIQAIMIIIHTSKRQHNNYVTIPRSTSIIAVPERAFPLCVLTDVSSA